MSPQIKMIAIGLTAGFLASCGSSPKLSEIYGDRHVVLFKDVSSKMINVFADYYAHKDQWVQTNQSDSCVGLGFEYVTTSSMGQDTNAKNYIDTTNRYACFEIYTKSKAYTGTINRALTLKAL